MAHQTALATIANRFRSVRRRLSRSGDAAFERKAALDHLEPFADSARAFQGFLRRCDVAGLKATEPTQGGDSVGVVVTPWVTTPVPWFSIALGLGLARRGTNVTFVWDDCAFPVPSPYLDIQNAWIDRILDDVRPHFPVVRLTEQDPRPPRADDEAVLDRLVELNLVWDLRGDSPTETELETARRSRHHLGEALNRLRRVIAPGSFRYVVVPGGVRGTSGLYLHVGGEAGTRVATFDSGLGWSVVCPDGVVAHQVDVPRAFEALYRPNGPELLEAIETARTEFDSRMRGSDRMAYQAARLEPVESVADDAILLPLSVEWDAAALGRHHIFRDSADWLVGTVGHLLEHTEAPVVVRQHPSERRELERSRFRVGPLLAARFGNHPRVRFVSAEEDVNTYNLLDRAGLVLPYVSTIGIEAAALGKIVIPAGRPYYGSLGFTCNAESREEYFELIGRALNGTLPPLPDQTRRAWLCFYINAVCYRVFTDFTPQSVDFPRWVRWEPDALFDAPEVEDLLTAIDEDIPVPLLRHARRTAHERRAAR